MSEELKACPFCWYSATYNTSLPDRINCSKDGCILSEAWKPHGIHKKTWNRRPEEERLQKRVAELEDEMSGTNIIELIELSGNEPFGFYQAGHVDKVHFVKEVEKEFDTVIPVESVRHVLARFVPYKNGSMFLLCSKKKRGTFLATYVEVI